MSAAPSHEALIRRIRALCSKADASDFPEEAEAFLAKAQQLMTRHAIDDAVIRRATGSSDGDVVCRTVTVPAPYASARVSLLAAAARPNSCRVALAGSNPDGQRCFLVGHAADVDLTLALYTHLDQQAGRAVRRSVSRGFASTRVPSRVLAVVRRPHRAAPCRRGQLRHRRGGGASRHLGGAGAPRPAPRGRSNIRRTVPLRGDLARRSASSATGLAHGSGRSRSSDSRATRGRWTPVPPPWRGPMSRGSEAELRVAGSEPERSTERGAVHRPCAGA